MVLRRLVSENFTIAHKTFLPCGCCFVHLERHLRLGKALLEGMLLITSPRQTSLQETQIETSGAVAWK